MARRRCYFRILCVSNLKISCRPSSCNLYHATSMHFYMPSLCHLPTELISNPNDAAQPYNSRSKVKTMSDTIPARNRPIRHNTMAPFLSPTVPPTSKVQGPFVASSAAKHHMTNQVCVVRNLRKGSIHTCRTRRTRSRPSAQRRFLCPAPRLTVRIMYIAQRV